MATHNFWQDIQQANQRKEGHRENSARHATLTLTFETSGSGELTPAQPIAFELPFFHEPSVLHGHTMVRRPDRRYWMLPRTVNGGVMRWERNNRGFYLAAFLYFVIDVPILEELELEPNVPMAAPIIQHHFAFTGPAYKQMGPNVNNAALDDAMRPLTPPAMP